MDSQPNDFDKEIAHFESTHGPLSDLERAIARWFYWRAVEQQVNKEIDRLKARKEG